MKLSGKSIGSRKGAQDKASGPAKRTILVAGIGTSPVVLTETVWALAHQEHPVVTDEIVVITTKSGKDVLRRGFHYCEIQVHGRIVILGYKCYNVSYSL